MAEPTYRPTPKPLSSRDAAALIGVLSVLEATSLAGHLDDGLAHSLKRRLHSDGQLARTNLGQAELRTALNQLNHRLRDALGEGDTSA